MQRVPILPRLSILGLSILGACLASPAVAGGGGGGGGGGGPAFQLEWGTFGNGPGQFNSPAGVAISSAGRVYVTDFANDRVEVFDLAGSFQFAWGSTGSAPGKFRGPTGVALDANGNVFVVDQGNARVQEFDPDGTPVPAFAVTGGPVLRLAYGIAVDRTGSVYVVNSGAHAIAEYDANGAFVRTWGSQGSGNGQFQSPKSLSMGPDGNVYVADFLNNRVQTFTPDGAFVSSFNILVVAGEYAYPSGIAVDSLADVYLCLNGNYKVREYTSAGGVLATWGGVGATPGLFVNPVAIAFDASGDVYVVDGNNNRVQRFGSGVLAVPSAGTGAADAGLRAFPNPSRGPVRFVPGPLAGAGAMEILDLGGRVVRHLGGALAGGLEWDGRDESGHVVGAGVYFAAFTGGRARELRRIVRVR